MVIIAQIYIAVDHELSSREQVSKLQNKRLSPKILTYDDASVVFKSVHEIMLLSKCSPQNDWTLDAVTSTSVTNPSGSIISTLLCYVID